MSDIQYPDHFIERLHTVWGEGFLSPGGPQEVCEIVKPIDVKGKILLDIGFSTAGPAMVLAGQLGAAKVIGIDVEEPLKTRAEALVDAAKLGGKIELRLVPPGPLPFDDNSFDLVFSKDSIIHIDDKAALFGEVLRVLRPGGWFAASDWLRGTGAEADAALEEMARNAPHLHFEMATSAEMEADMAEAGFAEIRTVDRNGWYAALVQEEIRQLTGPLYAELVKKVGKDIVDPWLDVRRGLAAATIGGGCVRPISWAGNRSDQRSNVAKTGA